LSAIPRALKSGEQRTKVTYPSPTDAEDVAIPDLDAGEAAPEEADVA